MTKYLLLSFAVLLCATKILAQTDYSSELVHKHKSEVQVVKLSPDGKFLASSGSDRTILVSTLKSKKHIQRFVEHHKLVTDLAFDSSGKYLASVGMDGKLCLWNIEEGKLVSVVFNEKNSYMADFVGLHFVFFHERYVYFGGEGALIYRADYTLPKPKSEIFYALPSEKSFVFKTFRSAIVSKDNQFIFIASGTDIYKLKISDANLVGIFKHTQEINHLAFTNDGKHLCSWHYDGKIAFWNPILGKTERHLQVAKHHSYGEVRFDRTGKLLLTGASDNVCKIWDLADGKLNAVLLGHTKLVRSYTFSPISEEIVTGSYDGEVKIWQKNFKTAEDILAAEEIDINATEKSKLAKGTTIKLPRITFEQNKAKMLANSKDDLEQLYMLLLKHSSLKIMLCGHTDKVDESTQNYKLSLKRAEEVKKYLVNKGIAAYRLEIKALGGSKPIYQTQQDLKRFNRRVEAVVLGDE